MSDTPKVWTEAEGSGYIPAGHPGRHGYKQCRLCQTWRRKENVVEQADETFGTPIMVCKDNAWCRARQREVTEGETG